MSNPYAMKIYKVSSLNLIKILITIIIQYISYSINLLLIGDHLLLKVTLKAPFLSLLICMSFGLMWQSLKLLSIRSAK
jgi:hypothetical protein